MQPARFRFIIRGKYAAVGGQFSGSSGASCRGNLRHSHSRHRKSTLALDKLISLLFKYTVNLILDYGYYFIFQLFNCFRTRLFKTIFNPFSLHYFIDSLPKDTSINSCLKYTYYTNTHIYIHTIAHWSVPQFLSNIFVMEQFRKNREAGQKVLFRLLYYPEKVPSKNGNLKILTVQIEPEGHFTSFRQLP